MMYLIHKLFSLIDGTMKTPSNYGWFHILSLMLMVLTVIIVAKSVKDNPDRAVKKTLIGFTVVSLTLEIMKQGLFTHVNSAYQWYAFPFQFCSTPMYIALLSLIVNHRKVKEAFYSFLAFYGLSGGLVVMLYPNDVYIDLIMIDIQTMMHHGGMVVVGCTLIFADKVKFNFSSLLKASFVFLGLVAIAFVLNISAFNAGLTSFNMFYISPYIANHLPILSTIYQTQPYIVFFLCYILGFGLAAFIMQKMGSGLNNLFSLFNTKRSPEKTRLLSDSNA